MFGLAAKLVLWMLGGYATYKVAEAVFAPEPKSAPRDLFKEKIVLQNKLDDVFALVADTERFEDPIFVEFGSSPGAVNPAYPVENRDPYRIYVESRAYAGGNALAPGNPVGYEYLAGVPNSAAARIAAIRAKIDGHGPQRLAAVAHDPEQGTVGDGGRWAALVRASEETLSKYTRSLIGTYEKVEKSVSDVEDIAASYGLSSDVVRAEAEEMVSFAKTLGSDVASNSAFLKQAYQTWGPVAQTVVTGIEDMVSGFSGEGDRKAVEGVLKILAAASLYVPVVGPLISAAFTFVLASYEEGDATEAQWCREVQQKIWENNYKRALTLNLPVPWHAGQIFNDSCPEGSATAAGWAPAVGQDALLRVMAKNLNYASTLSPIHKAHMQQWWSLALIYMSDPAVRKVFDAIGWDSYGGTIASDEQVMLVAAPIAVSYGFDIDDFARRLWVVGGGWKTAPEAAVTIGESERSYACAGNGDWYCSMTANAWWVQWAVLAWAALNLADELKGRVPPRSIVGDPSTLERVVVTVPPRPDMPDLEGGSDEDGDGGGGGLLGEIARSGLDFGGFDFGGAGKDWPGVLTLPEPYKSEAIIVLSGVSYAAIVAKTGAPCPGGCSSDAIYEVFHKLWLDQASVRGLGVHVDDALEELRAAYNRTKAYGL